MCSFKKNKILSSETCRTQKEGGIFVRNCSHLWLWAYSSESVWLPLRKAERGHWESMCRKNGCLMKPGQQTPGQQGCSLGFLGCRKEKTDYNWPYFTSLLLIAVEDVSWLKMRKVKRELENWKNLHAYTQILILQQPVQQVYLTHK